MLNLKIIITGLCLVCLQTLGQGVPKAYEALYYQGETNGRLVRFILANGYIGASTLKFTVPGKTKSIAFVPDAGVADEHYRLKFVASNRNEEFFILDNMQVAYEKIPPVITGVYFFKGKRLRVKFNRVKQDKR